MGCSVLYSVVNLNVPGLPLDGPRVRRRSEYSPIGYNIVCACKVVWWGFKHHSYWWYQALYAPADGLGRADGYSGRGMVAANRRRDGRLARCTKLSQTQDCQIRIWSNSSESTEFHFIYRLRNMSDSVAKFPHYPTPQRKQSAAQLVRRWAAFNAHSPSP